MRIVIGILVTALGGVLGAVLDLHFHYGKPSLYYFIGASTGIIGMTIALWDR